jgi:hypothetical protein
LIGGVAFLATNLEAISTISDTCATLTVTFIRCQ